MSKPTLFEDFVLGVFEYGGKPDVRATLDNGLTSSIIVIFEFWSVAFFDSCSENKWGIGVPCG